MAQQRVQLPRQVQSTGQQREPLRPFPLAPKAKCLDEADGRIDQCSDCQHPKSLVGRSIRRLEEEVRQLAFGVNAENLREPLGDVIEILVYQREHSKPEEQDKAPLRRFQYRDSAEADGVLGVGHGCWWFGCNRIAKGYSLFVAADITPTDVRQLGVHSR